MKKQLFLFGLFLSLLFCSTSLFGYVMYFEGRLIDENGVASSNQKNIEVDAYIYENASTTTHLSQCDSALFDTDENGYFGVYINNVNFPGEKDQYYLGLKLKSNGKEISPRMRIASAPYAIFSKKALKNNDERKSFSNDAFEINRLSTKTLQVGSSLTVYGLLQLYSIPNNISALYLKHLQIPENGQMSFFSSEASGVSTKWSSFTGYDEEIYVEKSDSKEYSFTASADGIITIASRTDESGGNSKFYITIKSGDYYICDNRVLETDTNTDGIECVTFTFPVRGGECVYVKGSCSKSGVYWRKGWIRIRADYFGDK